MALACMKAAKKLTFEYLEDTKGTGWWGVGGNADFYENLEEADNPWNWIRVINGTPSDEVKKKVGGDHAGKYECSALQAVYPEALKLERLSDSDDWFIQTAVDTSLEAGENKISMMVEDILRLM